jgi:acyl carrier protein
MNDITKTFDAVQTSLINFICQNFYVVEEDINLEESLVDTGIIDSFGLIEIASYIEKHYTVSVLTEDMTRENFGSVKKIVQFILRS